MNPLETEIRQAIEINGPLSVETFMGMVISHYYATRDPFGVQGDFTTAPEISQMFGEMVGIWVTDTWNKLGQPAHFHLIEAGPGRGTLMADILRTAKRAEGFLESAHIYLIETSAHLRDIQKETLRDYDVEWCNSLADPILQASGRPIIFVANELLDALPIRQYQCQQGKWYERVIGLENDRLIFGLVPSTLALPPEEGAVKEVSPAAIHFMAQLSIMIRDNTGAALLIDYGYDAPGFGDTLQAVKSHEFVSVLDDIGESDLTAHVDFKTLAGVSQVPVTGPVEQGLFLKNMGIQMRLERLKSVATPQQALDLQSGYVRLTADDQMGRLFKVMGLCHDPSIQLGGFTNG